MIKHPGSHVDHGFTEAQLRYLLDRFADQTGFFIDTIELPEQLGTVPCGLYGPIMGDAPINENEVRYARRGDRAWDSRLIVQGPIGCLPRATRKVTVIAGPHEEADVCPRCAGKLGAPGACDLCDGYGKIKYACILYTAFGGPLAPQEPGDPGCKDLTASTAFWRDHALAK